MARSCSRTISMDTHDSSSEHESILYDDLNDPDFQRIGNMEQCASAHPIPSMATAFEESISDSAEQVRTGKPPLQLSSLSAEDRRERLLSGEEYNDTYNAIWKEEVGSNYHPLRKLVAQIVYGVHLLHCRGAISNQEVIRILQRHIDEVDEFIRRADEDISMALSDIEARVGQLKFVLETGVLFDQMLDNSEYRTQVLQGNDFIRNIINRTASLMTDILADLKCGSESIKEMMVYMAKIGASWPTNVDIALYDTMLANTEGWSECFEDLNVEGSILKLGLVQLGKSVNQMAYRASNASNKQARLLKHNLTHQRVITSSHEDLLALSAREFSSVASLGSATNESGLSSSNAPDIVINDMGYTVNAIASDTGQLDPQDLYLRRRTNISEKRATAISDRRASTATIASLFVPMDDDIPAVPDVPIQPTIRKSKIPKLLKPKRPNTMSITKQLSFLKTSRSLSDARQGEPNPAIVHDEKKSELLTRACCEDVQPSDSQPYSTTNHLSKTTLPVHAPVDDIHLSDETPSQRLSTDLPVDLILSTSEQTWQQRNSPQLEALDVKSPTVRPVSEEPALFQSLPIIKFEDLGFGDISLPSFSEQFGLTMMSTPTAASMTSTEPVTSAALSIEVGRTPRPDSQQVSVPTSPRSTLSAMPSMQSFDMSSATLVDSVPGGPEKPREVTSSPSTGFMPSLPVFPTITTFVPGSFEERTTTSQCKYLDTKSHETDSSTLPLEEPKPIRSRKHQTDSTSIQTESPTTSPVLLHSSLCDGSSASSSNPTNDMLQYHATRISFPTEASDSNKIVLHKKQSREVHQSQSEEGYHEIKPPNAQLPTEQSGSSLVPAGSIHDQSLAHIELVHIPASAPYSELETASPSSSSIRKSDVTVKSKPISYDLNSNATVQLLCEPNLVVDGQNSHEDMDSESQAERSNLVHIHMRSISSDTNKKPNNNSIELSPMQFSMSQVLPPLPSTSDSAGGTTRVNSSLTKSPPPESLIESSPQSTAFNHSSMYSTPSIKTISPRPRSWRSRTSQSIDIESNGQRAVLPLAQEDVILTTDRSPHHPSTPGGYSRPATSLSGKPLFRKKLALFPSASPSMVDLRLRSDATISYNDRDSADTAGGIGEDADSALPGPPPRLIPKKHAGGRTLTGGMSMKLRKIMGFGRKATRSVNAL